MLLSCPMMRMTLFLFASGILVTFFSIISNRERIRSLSFLASSGFRKTVPSRSIWSYRSWIFWISIIFSLHSPFLKRSLTLSWMGDKKITSGFSALMAFTEGEKKPPTLDIRSVPGGYTLWYGIPFNETSAPMAKMIWVITGTREITREGASFPKPYCAKAKKTRMTSMPVAFFILRSLFGFLELGKKNPDGKIPIRGCPFFILRMVLVPSVREGRSLFFQAGLLTLGSSSSVKSPVRILNGICRAFPFFLPIRTVAMLRHSSPITAAGPSRLYGVPY